MPIRPNTTYRVRVATAYRPGSVAEISVTTPAAPPALRLALTAERAECTTGTLNPVTWKITGGVEPYRLTLDGASVDPDAEERDGHLRGPAGLRDLAEVTRLARDDHGGRDGRHGRDGDGQRRLHDRAAPPGTGERERTRPSYLRCGGLGFRVGCRRSRCTTSCAGREPRLRTGRTSSEFLEYEQGTRRGWYSTRLPEGTAYEIAVAVMRNPIERQTPEALTWSARVSFATVTDPPEPWSSRRLTTRSR